MNELLPNPSESDDYEWIELYNQGSTTVDLDSWQLADNSKSFILKAIGNFKTIIEAQGFLVIPKAVSGISLNNTGGEGITLKNPDGMIAGQTNYSESAGDNHGWARNESGGYEWTTTVTEGTTNIITQPIVATTGGGGGGGSSSSGGSSLSLADKKENATSSFQDKILITEILSNPLGLDGDENEWLEIYNTSTAAVILDGWKLKDNFGVYALVDTKIESKSFLILKRAQTQLILNNEGGDSLELSDREGKSVAKVSYKTKAPEGQSYNWCGRSWQWLVELTPGAENKCPPENDEPAAYFEVENRKPKVGEVIMINAEESYDTDGNIIKYIWQFDNEVVAGQEKNKIFETQSPLIGVRFLKPGISKIVLKVMDNLGGDDSYSEELEIQPDGQGIGNWENIFINEIMPNPKGVDAGQEWLEVYNGGEGEVNLKGLSLLVDKGKTYKINNDLMIAKGGYLVLSDKTTKLVLFNAGGIVRLVDAGGRVLREINYSQASEGWSYARDEENGISWAWTSSMTSGAENVFTVSQTKVSTSGSAVTVASGGMIKFVGRVTVEPGLLGKTIFYAEEDNGRGAQIYSYYKDFPNLAMSDKVEIVGTESDYQGERRIKIKSKNDIKVISVGEPLAPRKIQVEDIGEEIEGALVEIAGTLVEKKGATWWVDDGTEEVKVYLKENTGIKGEELETGDEVKIVGIVSQYQEEYRLLPRFQDDIAVVGKKVLGVTATDEQSAKQNKDGGEVIKYLLAIAVAVILGLLTYIIKKGR
ncbi:MAG TPA: lamin tail domain-containing protein [bacterium]|nr:lamin tail domain-containing protein [bacterium]